MRIFRGSIAALTLVAVGTISLASASAVVRPNDFYWPMEDTGFHIYSWSGALYKNAYATCDAPHFSQKSGNNNPGDFFGIERTVNAVYGTAATFAFIDVGINLGHTWGTSAFHGTVAASQSGYYDPRIFYPIDSSGDSAGTTSHDYAIQEETNGNYLDVVIDGLTEVTGIYMPTEGGGHGKNADSMDVNLSQNVSSTGGDVLYWNNFDSPITCHGMALDDTTWNNLTSGTGSSFQADPAGQTDAHQHYASGPNINKFSVWPHMGGS